MKTLSYSNVDYSKKDAVVRIKPRFSICISNMGGINQIQKLVCFAEKHNIKIYAFTLPEAAQYASYTFEFKREHIPNYFKIVESQEDDIFDAINKEILPKDSLLVELENIIKSFN